MREVERWRERGDEHVVVATLVPARGRRGGRLKGGQGRIHGELQPK